LATIFRECASKVVIEVRSGFHDCVMVEGMITGESLGTGDSSMETVNE